MTHTLNPFFEYGSKIHKTEYTSVRKGEHAWIRLQSFIGKSAEHIVIIRCKLLWLSLLLLFYTQERQAVFSVSVCMYMCNGNGKRRYRRVMEWYKLAFCCWVMQKQSLLLRVWPQESVCLCVFYMYLQWVLSNKVKWESFIMLYRSTSLQVCMPYQKLWFSTHKYSFCVHWCVFKCRRSLKTQVCKRARVCALLSRQLPCCNVSRWEEPVECKEVLRGETLNSCSSVPSGCSPSFEQQLSSLILSLAFFLSLPPTFSLSLDSFPGDFFLLSAVL